jgi:hypothetical protein
MGTYFELAGSRIANATRTWQAVEDADVSNWVLDDDFIVAISFQVPSNKSETGDLMIRWRDVTDNTTFADLSGAGELTWNAVTDLADGGSLTSSEAGATGNITASNWINGYEAEGSNAIGTTFANDYYSEHHWAVDCSGADNSHQYEFEMWDNTAGVSLGTCAAQITMVAGAAPEDINKWAVTASLHHRI